jgi:hypothetical protein
MADGGAREIKALLSTEDGNLEAHLRTLGESLPEDDVEAPVPEETFEALRNVRRSYKRLARSIRGIKTSSSAKRDALVALQSLDGGLKLFASGLREGETDTGRANVADGAAQTETAAADLAAATEALA